MHTLTLTNEQLRLLHNAVETWINSFSHDQPEQLREGKALRELIDAELAMGAGVGSATFSSN